MKKRIVKVIVNLSICIAEFDVHLEFTNETKERDIIMTESLIPSCVFELPNVKELIVWNTTKIPDTINQLSKLESLKILKEEQNWLSVEISNNIGNLKNLKELVISIPSLDSIDSSLDRKKKCFKRIMYYRFQKIILFFTTKKLFLLLI